jgi:hypothetical protein
MIFLITLKFIYYNFIYISKLIKIHSLKIFKFSDFFLLIIYNSQINMGLLYAKSCLLL